jgi:hypothetical protein
VGVALNSGFVPLLAVKEEVFHTNEALLAGQLLPCVDSEKCFFANER